jgi:hypothetical protein
MSSITTLLVFFTVFRNANAYSKFYRQFDHSTQISSTIRECAYYAKSSMMPLDETAAGNFVRLANLCHLCAYIGLSPHYNGGTFKKLCAHYHLLARYEEGRINKAWKKGGERLQQLGIPNTRMKAKSEARTVSSHFLRSDGPVEDSEKLSPEEMCDGPQGYSVLIDCAINRLYYQ